MREKIISVLMSTLILISTLGMASIIRPSFAEGGEDSIPSEDFVERKNQAALPSEVTKPYAKQEKPSESSRQISRNNEDKWRFNDTNEWTKFAYLDGNKTRLIVGAVNNSPAKSIELEKTAAKHHAEIVGNVSIGGQVRAVIVELSLTSVTAFVEDIRALDLASYVEPNLKVQAQLLPNDPDWTYQWGPQKIEADWAWNTTIGDPSILVAVVDTGIYYGHPDLAANYAPLGYDWVNMDADPLDDHGHGTHCAGIIAAGLNNGVGIAGLAQVRIMAEKVLDSSGGGTWDSVANGIIAATDSGANIISMSLAGYGDSELVHEAVKYAYDAGVLVIAAAANDNTNTKAYPAGYDEVIAVSATDQYDNKAWFSNWGDWIELAAPGVDIYSTVPWGYESWSGTSMATPHVSGVAALVWSRHPSKTRDWVRLWLRYSADDLGDPGFDIYYGYGRVNSRKAVEQAAPDHELIAYDWRTPPYVRPGATGIINATILNFGEENEADVTVQLLANDIMVDSTVIGFLVSGDSARVSLAWNPVAEGLYNITLYVVPVLGETSLENNEFSKSIYVGLPVKAVVLHSAGNVYGDAITNWQVLNTEWYLFGGTMIFVDYTALNKESITYEDIAATDADVLIISCAYDPYAGWQFTDAEIEAITQYVHEGHGLIATAGTLYSQVPNNNKLTPLFGLDETTMWGGTGTDLLHLLNTTHPILANVPNPLVFRQVGTALPYDGLWDSNELAGGKYLALGHYQESAIVTYRGLVYISPWLEVIPPYYHHHLQLLYNAITWSRYQKPEHELVVSLEAPKRLNPGEVTLLNATVFNRGRSDEAGIGLQLFIDDVMVDSVTIPELSVDSSYTLSYLWTSAVQGVYNVTAYAPPISGEEFTENNISEKKVTVLLIVVRSVLVYTDDYVIAPSSRYLIVALDNLGISYTHYSDDPWGFSAALVSQPWDLVVVDHCNYYAMGYYWTELEEYVRNGGLLILSTFDIDGSNSEPTTLWNTLGVRWVSDMSYPEPVYRWVSLHSIFTFPNTVGDLTSYTEDYYDHGDHVASTTGTPVAGFTTSPSEGYASVVVGNVYRTVLFSFKLAEFRYDQDGDGKLDAVELWENAIVYANTPVEHDIAVNMEAPKSVKPSESALLNATVSNKGLNDEIDVELQIIVDGSVVQSATIDELLTSGFYTLSYLFTPTVEGIYNVTAYALPVSGEDNIQNNVGSARVIVSTLLVALFQNWYPWDYPSNEEALDRYGMLYVVFSSSDFGRVDLSMFRKVVITSDQDQAFYNGMDMYRWWFEDYVRNGGLLEIHAADYGWHGGGWIGALPGGFGFANYGSDYVTIIDYAHPVVTTPNSISDAELDYWSYSVHGYFHTYPADSHIVIIEDPTQQPAYLEFNYGAGFIVASSQALEWGYKNQRSRILENSLLYMPMRYEHDLAVSVVVPTYLESRTSTLLNATVRNRGLNNEADVELYLLVDGTAVGSAAIAELRVGESYTINCAWTPTAGGSYNITAYVPPVPGEEDMANNVMTKQVNVFFYARYYLPHEWIGDGDPMGWHADDSSWQYDLPFDFPFYNTYYRTIYISSNGLMTFILPDQTYSNSISGLAGKLAIAVAWDDWLTYSPNDIYVWQPDSNHVIIRWDARHISSGAAGNFEATLGADGVIQFNYEYNDGPITATIGISNGAGHILAEDVETVNCTNTVLFTPFQQEHDLAVTLDAPAMLSLGSDTILSATICNTGLGNETNVTIQLIIDGNTVASEAVSELASGYFHTLTYPWIPTIEGTYNITAYSPPVEGETVTHDNIAVKLVRVRAQGPLPPDRPAVYVNRTITTTDVGSTFTISVNIFNLTDTYAADPDLPGHMVPLGNLYGFDVQFTWDPTMLQYVSHTVTVPEESHLGGILHSPPDPLEIVNVIKEDGNIPEADPRTRAWFAYSTFFPAIPFNNLGESNTVFFMTFRAIAQGNSILEIVSADLANDEASPILHSNMNGLVKAGGASGNRDVAVVNATASPCAVYAGRIVNITAVVANQGNMTETFNTNVYANNTLIGTRTIHDLAPMQNLTLFFSWNTTGLDAGRSYVIWVEASTVPDETNTENNRFIDGQVKIKLRGDINGDDVVDIFDVILAVISYGSHPGDPDWNPDADLAWPLGQIDIYDLVTLTSQYGKTP